MKNYLDNFIQWFQSLPEGTADAISFLLNVKNLIGMGSIVAILWKVSNSIYKIFQGKRYDSWERPMGLNVEDVTRIKKYYIKTRLKEEISNSRKIYNINSFIRKFFKTGVCAYHWILGEAGMGKTTFLVRLYYQYNTKLKVTKRFNDIFYVRFGCSIDKKSDLEVLEEYINKVKKEKSTRPSYKSILLVDAFDEWNESHINYQAAQNKIYKLTKDVFTITIISCRTQFFNNKISEPHYVEADPSGLEFTPSMCRNHYIQPFSNRDTRKYLRMVYPILSVSSIKNLKKRMVAASIIRKVKEIICRPFLLRYIDDILQEGKKNAYDLTSIYYIILNRWIKREISKTVLFTRKTEEDKKENWWMFLRQITQQMYQNYNSIYEYSIDVDYVDALAVDLNINIENLAKEGRSLLSRSESKDDYSCYFWFTHQSIFEFLLADCVANGINIFNENDTIKGIVALDQYKIFLTQMLEKGMLDNSIREDEICFSEMIKSLFSECEIYVGDVNIDFRNILDIHSEILINIDCKSLSSLNYGHLRRFFNKLHSIPLHKFLTLTAITGNIPVISKIFFGLENKNGDEGLLSDQNQICRITGKNHQTNILLEANIFDDNMPLITIQDFITEQTKVQNGYSKQVLFKVLLERSDK